MGRKRGVVCSPCDCHPATPLHPPGLGLARHCPITLCPRRSALSSLPHSLSQLSPLAPPAPTTAAFLCWICLSRSWSLSCFLPVSVAGAPPWSPHPASLCMHSTGVLEPEAPPPTRGHSTHGPGAADLWACWSPPCGFDAPSSCCHKRETQALGGEVAVSVSALGSLLPEGGKDRGAELLQEVSPTQHTAFPAEGWDCAGGTQPCRASGCSPCGQSRILSSSSPAPPFGGVEPC